jgi:hypothetical protein
MCFFEKKGKNSSDNVSLELVNVGWDFGDHHYDNSKIISDYNSLYIKFYFRIFIFSFSLYFVGCFTPFQCFLDFFCLYFIVNFSNESDFS